MENLNLKAQQDRPGLRRWVNELLVLLREMMQQPVPYTEEDHLGFMALCFLSKQIEHMNSILILVDNEQGRDAELIARSMIEGLGQLLWAANDAQRRALRWRAFAWIHDWRTMNAQISAGEPVDQNRRAEINTALAQYGDQFLTRCARRRRQTGMPLPPDPYCQNWTGHNYSQILDWIQGGLLRQKLYKPFSAWHHWSPGGLGVAIVRDRNAVTFLAPSPTASATALATGFQCLVQTAELVDSHLRLGFHSRIAELREGYITWYETHSDEMNNNGN